MIDGATQLRRGRKQGNKGVGRGQQNPPSPQDQFRMIGWIRRAVTHPPPSSLGGQSVKTKFDKKKYLECTRVQWRLSIYPCVAVSTFFMKSSV